MAIVHKYNVEIETDQLSGKRTWKLVELLIEAGYSVYGNFDDNIVGFEISSNRVAECTVSTGSPATNNKELQ